MSIASVASQQAGSLTAAANSAASTSASSASTAAAAGNGAMGTLSGNFQTFLKMLMTQLQNQDPTSPLDTNQFTSQLVQFASVEQQINTNSSLTSLIQLTQATGVLQSSSMVGHQVAVESDHLTLQNGSAKLQFTAPAAGQVAVAIYSDSGTKLADALVNATKGSNSWSWNGTNSIGNKVADGSYRVAVVGANQDGSTLALPFTVVGTATGVEQQDKSLQLQLGGLAVDFSKVKSVLN